MKGKRRLGPKSFRDGTRRNRKRGTKIIVNRVPDSTVNKLRNAGVTVREIVEIGRQPNPRGAAEKVLREKGRFRKPV